MTTEMREKQYAEYEAGLRAGRAAYEEYGRAALHAHADEPERDAWQQGYHDGAIAAEAHEVVERLQLDAQWASQYDNRKS